MLGFSLVADFGHFWSPFSGQKMMNFLEKKSLQFQFFSKLLKTFFLENFLKKIF